MAEAAKEAGWEDLRELVHQLKLVPKGESAEAD